MLNSFALTDDYYSYSVLKMMIKKLNGKIIGTQP